MSILKTLASLLPAERRIKSVVDVAVIILAMVARSAEGTERLASDPDRAIELAIEQAIKHTGVKLNAKEIRRAVGRIVLQQALDALKERAEELQRNMERLRVKHPNVL